MHEEPRMDLVSAMVEAIDERTPAQDAFIVGALVRKAWPGGVGDRVEPVALEWIKRWGPARMAPEYLEDCSCLEGRCAVCN
jgi:hypothetical protein